MFIQTQATPNPDALRLFSESSVFGGRLSMSEKGQARGHPAEPYLTSLLDIPGIRQIFLDEESLTITKEPEAQWSSIKPHALGIVADWMAQVSQSASHPHVANTPDAADTLSFPSSQSVAAQSVLNEGSVEARIHELIETYIQPSVQSDGGYIKFDRYEDGIVYVDMQGACVGCPSSTITLKRGIYSILKAHIPDIQDVQPIA